MKTIGHSEFKISQYFYIITAIVFAIFPGNVNSQSNKSFRDCTECPEMVEIPKGSFLMGSYFGRLDEMPKHQVEINYNFAVSKYEITRNQYTIFINDSNHSSDEGCEVYDLPSFNMNLKKSWLDPDFSQDSNHPVVCVNWHDAQAYVSWLSKLTGDQYRLLSESEWEYVARAGSTTSYSFGDSIDSMKANYDDQYRATTPVGSYAPNEFGIFDVHGNAAEWVIDCWVDNYANAPSSGEPMTAGACDKRILRGGTWHNQPQYLRSAFRNGYFANFRLSGIGFRIAKSL
jgi:formylglycine-generating enzyme required for sulfatase activity